MSYLRKMLLIDAGNGGSPSRARMTTRKLRSMIATLSRDRTVCSDLGRAHDTALILGIDTPECTTALREIDVGEWTGRPIADIRAGDPDGYRGWRAGTHTPPGGGTWSDFVTRTAACIKSALADSYRLLVVCHSGVIRALLETLIGLPPKRIIPVGPASLTILAERPDEAGSIRLELFNYSPLGPILDAPD